MRPCFKAHVVLAVLASTASVPALADSGADHLTSLQACAIVRSRLAAVDHVSRNKIDKAWHCELESDVQPLPPQWWIIAMVSNRQCHRLCRIVRGLYAVNRKSGAVQLWDVGRRSVAGPVN